MNNDNGAQYIAKFLKRYGVTHVFYVLAILRKGLIHMEEEGITRITAHSEKSAVYMADGYARVSKRPGVAMAQSVGAANLAAGLQDAFLAHVPVVAVTGRKPFYAQHRNAYQEITHGPMYEPVTKYRVTVDDIRQLPMQLRQAFREATSGAPRPVHLDLLGFTGEIIEQGTVEEPMMVEEEFTSYPAVRFAPEDSRLKQAVAKIQQAQRPVLVYGSGAASSDAGEQLLELSKRFSMPVAYSCHGKSLIPDNYWLNSGSVGTYSCPCANKIVAEADLVIFVGTGTGDQITLNWSIPADEVNKIQIDINPAELGRNYSNTFGLLGDAKLTLQKLLGHCSDGIIPKTSWAEYASSTIEQWKTRAQKLRNADAVPIRPERLCKEISDMLPSNAVVVADTGYSAIWACSMIELTSIDQIFIRAAGSLGWAFPASLGAKCAAPDRPVFSFIGDGGFWYHIGELETAKRCGIKTVTVVNNNSAFGQSIAGVSKAYGSHPGNKEELYTFTDINFANLAKEIGCFGIRVEDPKDLASALKQALDSDLPAVVDVVTDPDAVPQVAWSPE